MTNSRPLTTVDDLDDGEFPRFRVVVCDLGRNPAVYEAVMNDVLVAKTGRFQLVGDEKQSVDPMTGNVITTLRVIDRGPEGAAEDRY